ncbi:MULTISPECIES: phage antirepressor [Pseudomonas]|uniref:phage antirepressor n=1 Tax=Pseudomonas TaxID=286 RepID=UPI001E5C2153|nr:MULTISPECIES: phage antirepressor [Pseudomonas]MCE0881081.1 phage antirepressor [Pseudomonas putida]MDD2013071.1 phage antirepressor [Pseudomonas putida]HDS1780770.1 phage antirepressor [Pseudomonas putida]
MNLVTTASDAMDTIELLALVNDARAEFGEPTVRRNVFVERCKDELEGEHYKTFVVQNLNNTQSEELRLTADQCKLVAMRESKGVRRRVLARLNELEGQARRPMTQAELIAASANQLVAIERQQAEQQLALERVEDRTARLEQIRYLDSVPSGFETITTIRDRINRRHGLPAWVVNAVMREVSCAPLPYAFVRSRHADEGGQPFAIWPRPAVTQRFDRFVTECAYETAERATHPEIPQGRFKIHPRQQP